MRTAAWLLLRHVCAITVGEPKRQPNDEQKASMTLYSTEERKVRAKPTRRPNRGYKQPRSRHEQ